MTLILQYPTKKALKGCIGQRLAFSDPGLGLEYKRNGIVYGCNRPHITGYKREFFARITMKDDIIVKVE